MGVPAATFPVPEGRYDGRGGPYLSLAASRLRARKDQQVGVMTS